MKFDDNEFLRALRARVLYAGYKNSLVEWTVSKEWTSIHFHSHARRGMRKRVTTVPVKYHADTMSGEIQCR